MSEQRPPFSPRLIGILAFCFTWYPGAVLVGLNAERYGKPEQKWPILIGATLLFPIWLVGLWMIPDSVASALTAVHVGIAVGLARWQRESWQAHQAAGGEAAGWGLPLAGSLLLVSGLFGLLMGVILVDDMRFDEGQQLIAEERFDEAEPIFRDYAETWDDPGAWCNLAIAVAAQGRQTEALQHLNRCVEGDPSIDRSEFQTWVRSQALQ